MKERTSCENCRSAKDCGKKGYLACMNLKGDFGVVPIDHVCDRWTKGKEIIKDI